MENTMKTTRLCVEVDYDPKGTKPEYIADRLDFFMDASREKGTYQEYLDSSTRVMSFEVAREPLIVKASSIRKVVSYDPEPDAEYAVRMAKEGMPEELKAIEEGDLVGYYCQAVVDVEIPLSSELPDYTTDRGKTCIVQKISSPGLWSIFAKSSDDPYFDEVFSEEKRMLIHMLTTLGIRVVEEKDRE